MVNGFATLSFFNSDEIYEGDWKDNVKSGNGEYRYNSLEKYTGEWLND